MRLQQGFPIGEIGFKVSLHGSNPEPLMSALGHYLPRPAELLVSALPPKAAAAVADQRGS
jgi:hypothetical protein